MAQIRGVNPWRSMWDEPRKTVRAIVLAKPTFGVFLLATLYALVNLFFLAGLWSLGLKVPFFSILIGAVLLAPLLGWAWIYIAGWVFYFTGRLLKGRAPRSHLRAAIAWSKIPAVLSLFIWVIFLVAQPEYVFIQDAGGVSSLFVDFISLSLGVWSLILLIQALREVQKFSLGRALVNILFAWAFSGILYLLVYVFFRYIYLTVL
ncbi:MAG: YIP1 family protein [Chlamydiota bacterium]